MNHHTPDKETELEQKLIKAIKAQNRMLPLVLNDADYTLLSQKTHELVMQLEALLKGQSGATLMEQEAAIAAIEAMTTQANRDADAIADIEKTIVKVVEALEKVEKVAGKVAKFVG